MIGTVHRRLRLEPENDGLADDFPIFSSSRDVFSGSMSIFRGVIYFTRDDCFDGWTSLITMTIKKSKDDFEKKTHLYFEQNVLRFCLCIVVS